MIINFNIKPNSLQRELLEKVSNPENKTIVVKCSRQIGKSLGCEILVLQYLLTPNNSFNAWIAPTFRQCKKVMNELIDIIPNQLIKSYNKSDLVITLKNGNVLQFFSGESIQSVRGFTLRGILIIDECAFIKEDEDSSWYYEVILPITKASINPKIVIVSTPNGKVGEYFRQYQKAFQGEKGYALIEKTIYDDDLISQEQIEEIKRNTPELIFRQEFLCEFLDDAQTVFKGFEYCFSDFEFDFNSPIWYGVDTNTSGDDNTVLTLINDKNQVYQYVYKGYNLELKIKQLANDLNKISKPIKGYFEINSIGRPLLLLLDKYLNSKIKSTLNKFVTSNPSKNEIINQLIIEIQNKNIHFQNSNKLLYSELSTFSFKISASKNVIYSAIEGHHDDTVLSLAFALHAKQGKTNILKNNKLISANYEKIE